MYACIVCMFYSVLQQGLLGKDLQTSALNCCLVPHATFSCHNPKWKEARADIRAMSVCMRVWGGSGCMTYSHTNMILDVRIERERERKRQ